MSYYYDPQFINKIDCSLNIIFEVGARYGDETLELSKVFPNANIFSFECNPLTVEIARKKLLNKKNIKFFDFGLGEKNEIKSFYSYTKNNDGCSSFLQRIDFNKTQKETGKIPIRKLKDIVEEIKNKKIDLLCMDVQGYELNILKGAEDFIENINYIIIEEPKKNINKKYLPEHLHSKYINAPSSYEIQNFLSKNNFYEIERIEENKLEDNVMYKRKKENFNI